MGFSYESFLYGIRFISCYAKRCSKCYLYEEGCNCNKKIEDNLINFPEDIFPNMAKEFRRVFAKYPKIKEEDMKEIADRAVTLFNWAE